jgi:hypothetical protein
MKGRAYAHLRRNIQNAMTDILKTFGFRLPGDALMAVRHQEGVSKLRDWTCACWLLWISHTVAFFTFSNLSFSTRIIFYYVL